MDIIEKAWQLFQIIKGRDDFIIIAHADADGVAGASILKAMLDEMGKGYEIKFVDYLNEEILEKYKNCNLLLVDVGNGNLKEIKSMGINAVVIDHHFSYDFFENSINPFHYGIDGGYEISASGLAHLIARNVKGNADIAIIGAIGDLQDRNGLRGWNRTILKESNIIVRKDIRLYGRNRPLYVMLSFSHLIPPFFKNVGTTIKFLKGLGINENKAWNDLEWEEKKKVFSSIAKMMIRRGYEMEDIENLYGEVYEISFHDVREIAAAINSMAKYGEYKKAMEICIKRNFDDAQKFLDRHRKNIKNGIKIARERLNDSKTIKYFYAGNKIKDTILGTITGMLLESQKIKKPVVGLAENENEVKISARAPRNMNVNLSIAMKNAASRFGGEGGGHRMAAGATIPKGYENDFLQIFEAEIESQSVNL